MTTVLVVDDDRDNRLLATLSLERAKEWRILEASNGWDAVEIARSASPDAILLDLVMPGLDGIATFQALQDDPATRTIPVILMTASWQVGPTHAWDGLAIASVLTKPFSAIDLPAHIAAILGWAPPDTSR